MRHIVTRTLLGAAAAALVVLAWPAHADAVVGQPAPGFTLPDSAGKTRSLAEFKGKVVVLEWVNPECPFVKKHYASGNMQKLQKTYAAKGVVWLTVNSSAPGKQGHLTPATAGAFVKEQGAAPTAILLDPQGQAGRAYGAKTTPHMYVIDKQGQLVYAGAIDDKPSTDPDDIPGARSYVTEGLDAVLAGKPVGTATTTPYGCSVKY
jgi:hypothetical protein